MNFYNIFNSNELNFSDDDLLKKIKNLLSSFFFSFLLIMIVVLTIISPLDILLTNFFHLESIKELISQTHEKINSFPYYLIIFIAPFMEEVLFRLSLKVNRLNISVFLGVLLYIVLGGKVITFELNNNLYIMYIVVGALLSIISYYFLPSSIINLLTKNKNVILILSIFLFGIIHVFNIKTVYWQLTLIYPFYVLPQIIMGYFISNLRLKYGFLWGFMLHALINAFSILVSHF